MCQFIHQPCDRDSVAVKIMKKFGAIPFCLTNVPQTMYSMQCSNPPYGTTGSNPESIKKFLRGTTYIPKLSEIQVSDAFTRSVILLFLIHR